MAPGTSPAVSLLHVQFADVLGLVLNTGLLVALVTVLDLVSGERRLGNTWRGRVIVGVAAGLIGIGLMAAPLHSEPGVQFDTRSVLLSVCGLFLGVWPTVIAASMMGLFRVWLGGAWAVGLSVIVASCAIGYGWRFVQPRLRGAQRGWGLYVMGVIVHVVMLSLISAIPDVGPRLARQMALPVMLIYPAATVALGLLLMQRRRAEETTARLRDSERRYRDLFDVNPQPMWVYDRETLRFLAVNQRAIKVYGYSRDEFLAMSIADIRTPDEVVRMQRAIADKHWSRSDEITLWRHVVRDGRIIEVEVTAHSTTFEGRPARLVIAHDVTAARRAQADRDRLIAAIEQSDDSIVITDRDGKIEYVNPAFEQVSGYTREEALGNNPRILKSGAQDEATYRELWATITSGRTWHGRLVNRRKDGSLYTEDATISPVRHSDGTVGSFVAVKRDVTRELEVQVRSLQAQKMEGVGWLAAGVAHDFNNLLTIINGSAELASGAVAPDDPVAEDLRQILAAGARGGALTRQLLAFSRQQVVQPVELDLDEVIDGFRRMLARLLKEDIVLEVRRGLDHGRVIADPGQIEQIILNLAVNARDAMPGGGVLTIATTTVRLDETSAVGFRPPVATGLYACISVSDTGTGMDETTLAKIFEPFFTTKDVGRGTGLGLATVHRIVGECGGGVLVTSGLGRGSRFDVFLPVTGSVAFDVVPDPTAPESLPEGARGTVLVVEDEESVRQLAWRALLRAGFQVVLAAHGREALEIMRSGTRPDLVATDVIMPEMGGRELATILAADYPNVPVLYTSGYTGDQAVAEWISNTGVPFLPKPYTPGELVRAVSAALDPARPDAPGSDTQPSR